MKVQIKALSRCIILTLAVVAGWSPLSAAPPAPSLVPGTTTSPNIAPGVSGNPNVAPGVSTNLPSGASTNLPPGVSNKPL